MRRARYRPSGRGPRALRGIGYRRGEASGGFADIADNREVVPLDHVPDAACTNCAVGEGIAVRITDKLDISPANGTLVKVFDTHHAFYLETDNGAEVVERIGIDTVFLDGQGFTFLVKKGSKVT